MNSKLLRSELKSIVKECLIEILSEGILGNTKSTIKENKIDSPRKKRNSLGYLDKIKQKKKKPNINTNLSDDPIMNEIFADTARSTLQEQVGADSKNNMGSLAVATQGDQAARIVDQKSPEDIFGDSADKWASLAFS